MNWLWKERDSRSLLVEALQLLEGEADPTSQPVIQKLNDISTKLAKSAGANSEAITAIAEAIKFLQIPNLAEKNKPLAIESAKLQIQSGINSVIALEMNKIGK
jgi:hypothetical protein